MRIAVYAQWFRLAGTREAETYFRNLTKALQAAYDQNKNKVYVNKSLVSELSLYKDNFKVHKLPKVPSMHKLLREVAS